MGKGRAHPWMSRQFIAGPNMSICGFGTYKENTFHVVSALGIKLRTLGFSAQPPNRLSYHHSKKENPIQSVLLCPLVVESSVAPVFSKYHLFYSCGRFGKTSDVLLCIVQFALGDPV